MQSDAIVTFGIGRIGALSSDGHPAIGVADSFSGLDDEARGVPRHEVMSLPDLAIHLRQGKIEKANTSLDGQRTMIISDGRSLV